MTGNGALCYNNNMKFFKRYWSIVLTAAMIPLLLFLAVNQIRWIRDLGVRERYRLVQALHSTANQLGNAIQNEIAVIPVLFDFDCDEMAYILSRGDFEEFEKRWTAWKTYAQSPDIISELYIIVDEGRFDITSTAWQWEETAFERVAFKIEDSGLFVFPLRPGNTANRYKLVIKFNNDVLSKKLIPPLAEQFLFGKNDYYFRVIDRVNQTVVYESSISIPDGIFDNPDIRYPLLRPDFLFTFSRLPENRDPNFDTVPAMTILQLRRQYAATQKNPDLAAEGFSEPRPPEQRDRIEGARWVLEAVHKSGSLKAVVNTIMLRNTILSMGTFLLLALAILALTIAVRRNQELAERQQDFIATVTHELKTPVAVIKAAADNLASGIVAEPERARKYGAMIMGESNKLATMVDRLLIYSRLSSHKQLELAPLDLRKLINMVLQQYESALAEAEFRVEVIAPESLFVRGDEQTLGLALGNLVNNALKHARDGAFLGIDIRQEQNKWAIIAVRDHGPGIPRQERKQVFEAFYRGVQARENQVPGSGLGLNVVRRIIETHGGTISCESMGDLGALFIIKLPLHKETGHGKD